jgi:hypothetical protein
LPNRCDLALISRRFKSVCRGGRFVSVREPVITSRGSKRGHIDATSCAPGLDSSERRSPESVSEEHTRQINLYPTRTCTYGARASSLPLSCPSLRIFCGIAPAAGRRNMRCEKHKAKRNQFTHRGFAKFSLQTTGVVPKLSDLSARSCLSGKQATRCGAAHYHTYLHLGLRAHIFTHTRDRQTCVSRDVATTSGTWSLLLCRATRASYLNAQWDIVGK